MDLIRFLISNLWNVGILLIVLLIIYFVLDFAVVIYPPALVGWVVAYFLSMLVILNLLYNPKFFDDILNGEIFFN